MARRLKDFFLVLGMVAPLLACLYVISTGNLVREFNLRSLERVGLYGGVVGLLLLFFYWRKPNKIGWVIATLFVLFFLSARHAEAVVGFGIFSLASYLLGTFTIDTFFPIANDKRFTGIKRNSICLLVGVSLNGFFSWVAIHFPINYSATHALFFISQILIFRNRAQVALRDFYLCFSKEPSSGQFIILWHACLMLPYQLVPGYNFDDVMSHLYIPKTILKYALFPFSPNYVPGYNVSFIPMGTYTSLFLMSGEYAVRLLNYSLFYVAFFIIESYVRLRATSRAAFWSTAVAVSTPYLTWTLGIVFVDGFYFASSVLLLLITLELVDATVSTEDNTITHGFRLFSILAVIAYLCKQQNIALIVPAVLAVVFAYVYRLLKGRDKFSFRPLIEGATLFVGSLSIPLIVNHRATGNPLYPFFNGYFKSPYFSQTNFVDNRWNHPLRWDILYDMTFHGTKYVENINYSLGFWLLILLPIFALYVARTTFKGGEVAVRYNFFILILFVVMIYVLTGPYLRYWIGGIMALAVILGMSIDWVQNLLYSKLAKAIASCSLGAVLVLNLASQFSVANVPTPYPIVEVFSGNFDYSSMGSTQELKKLYLTAKLRFGEDSLGLLVRNYALYLAETKVESLGFHFPVTSTAIMNIGDTNKLFSFLFEERKFDYLIMPTSSSEDEIITSAEFRKLLQPIAEKAGFVLYAPLR